MAATEDGESARGSYIDLAPQAVYTGTGKGKWSFGKCQNWNAKGGRGGKDGGKNSWQEGSGKKEIEWARERWQWRNQNMMDRVARQDTLQPGARKEATKM